MAFQAITTHSFPLPRWQSNSPVFRVPNFVRLHEYKPQKTWCLRSMFKKKPSEFGAEDIKNLKWDTEDSKEDNGSAVIASEDYKKTQNGKTIEEDGNLEAMVKLLLVEAAAQKDMIAAQKQMIVDLQKRVAPSSELTAAQEQMTVDLQRTVSLSSELTDVKDQRIQDLQKRVERLEFNAAQQQMIADLQQKIAQLELDAELKSKPKTPPTEFQAQSKSERRIPPKEIHAQSKPKTEAPPAKIQSESKTKTPSTKNHVSGVGKIDEQHQRTSLVYFPASSDKEEPTGVNDDYTMAAMNALQKMQLDLKAESKSRTKTPPTKNHVSGVGKTDEQHQRNSLVYFPASSDEKEPTGVNDDYTMAAMNVLQKMQLDLKAESKSKTKTPPTKNHVSGVAKTDEQHQKTSLVYFPAPSDEKDPTGVNDDYTMTAMNALQKMQLDLNAESKSKAKTPPTENHVSDDSKIDEQHQRNSLLYFPASDEEEPTRVNDDYAMTAMNALQRMQLDLNAESKSKMGTSLKTPQTESRVLSDDETGEEELTDDYTMTAMNALQRMQLDLTAESKPKMGTSLKTPQTESRVLNDDETGEEELNDDYTMTAINALQRMQLNLNAESKSKMGTSLKTPQIESRVLSDDETGEEELSSDEDEQREKSPLVNFSASSDGEEQPGFKDDNYTMAVMNVLLRTQMERNTESKSKMETPLKTPQTVIQLSDDETDKEEHSSDTDEQRERTQPVNFSASSNDDEYTNTIMNQISKTHKMRFTRKARKM